PPRCVSSRPSSSVPGSPAGPDEVVWFWPGACGNVAACGREGRRRATLAGIVRYGSYVPYFRLSRAAMGAGKGERAVASYDEDSVSMAVEAARDAVRGDVAVDTLLFATTSPAYAEKLDTATARRALQAAGVEASALATVILDGTNPRSMAGLPKALGLRPEQVADPLAATVGRTGVAHAGLLVARALDRAKPGDRILVVCEADGADALVLEVTDAIEGMRPVRKVDRW